jgi:hypothetical protein
MERIEELTEWWRIVRDSLGRERIRHQEIAEFIIDPRHWLVQPGRNDNTSHQTCEKDQDRCEFGSSRNSVGLLNNQTGPRFRIVHSLTINSIGADSTGTSRTWNLSTRCRSSFSRSVNRGGSLLPTILYVPLFERTIPAETVPP